MKRTTTITTITTITALALLALIPAGASAAPRFKKNGSFLAEGAVGRTAVAGQGTLRYQTVLGGTYSYECRNALGGWVENSAGVGVGSVELLASYDCTFSACPTFAVLAAESLPWNVALSEPMAGQIRATLTGRELGQGIKVSFQCWPNRAEAEKLGGTPDTHTNYVGMLSPRVERGTSATYPSFLEYGPAVGRLEQEGSAGTIQDEVIGKLRFLGYSAQALITVE